MTCTVFEKTLESNVDPLALIVDSYFSVPFTTVRAVAVPSSKIIPAEAFDSHCLTFLDLKHVKLYGLNLGEFEEMEKKLMLDEEIGDKKE